VAVGVGGESGVEVEVEVVVLDVVGQFGVPEPGAVGKQTQTADMGVLGTQHVVCDPEAGGGTGHSQHRGLGVLDLLVAATAVHHDLTVLHVDNDFTALARVLPEPRERDARI
jgi:hypothetical protein